MSLLENLPIEILLHIIKFLDNDFLTLKELNLVNKFFHKLLIKEKYFLFKSITANKYILKNTVEFLNKHDSYYLNMCIDMYKKEPQKFKNYINLIQKGIYDFFNIIIEHIKQNKIKFYYIKNICYDKLYGFLIKIIYHCFSNNLYENHIIKGYNINYEPPQLFRDYKNTIIYKINNLINWAFDQNISKMRNFMIAISEEIVEILCDMIITYNPKLRIGY